MTTRTTNTKGLARPGRGESAKPGIGASMSNAKSLNTSQDGHKPGSGRGLPSTYFGNSKACASTAKGKR